MGIGVLGIEKSCNHLLKGDTTNITLRKGANGKYFNTQILDENDPSLFRAIADYLGYGLTKESYQKKFD